MASCITTKWSNSYTPQVQLTVTQSSSTDTTATLSWTLQYIAISAASVSSARAFTVKINGSVPTNGSGSFAINGKTGTHTIASGTVTINKGTAAKDIAFSVSFAFNLTWNGVYGGTKTASGSITVAKKTSYTVKYNANGGTGAPAAQTKWYGTTLTLSTTKPTRAGYTFKGWSTSSSATSATYSAGGSYTANSAATLYAVWGTSYKKPRITNYSGERTSDGTGATISFNWATDNSNPTIAIVWKNESGAQVGSSSATGSGTSGTYSKSLTSLNGDIVYTIEITVTDSGGNTKIVRTLPGNVFPIDFLAGGNGTAVGKAATMAETFDCAWAGYFRNGITVNGRAYGTNKVLWSGSYWMNSSHTITLSEAVSAQPHGIVVVFSYYANSAIANTNFHACFIPKEFVATYTGATNFTLAKADFSVVGNKALFFKDTTITGAAANVNTGSNSGVTYANNAWVLCRVIGV